MAVRSKLVYIAACDVTDCGAIYADEQHEAYFTTPEAATGWVEDDGYWTRRGELIVCPIADSAHDRARGGESPVLLDAPGAMVVRYGDRIETRYPGGVTEIANCAVCRRPVQGKTRLNRCGPCYNRLRRQMLQSGKIKDRSPAAERVLRRTIAASDGCVLFTGWLNQGYGRVEVAGRGLQAHRVVYEALVGPIPEGLVLDHLCHNRDLSCPGGDDCVHRRCVNPSHLAPVTHEVNSLTGRSSSAQNLTKTHCPQGHEYSPENTRVERRLGRSFRRCRACHRTRAREAARAKRQREVESGSALSA